MCSGSLKCVDVWLWWQIKALFEDLLKTSPPGGENGIAGYLRYAVAHRDVIARFGRFPHRNAALGRESTPQELEYLAEPGAGF